MLWSVLKNTVAVCACAKSATKSWRYQSKKSWFRFSLFLTSPPGAAETVQVSFFCSVFWRKLCKEGGMLCDMCWFDHLQQFLSCTVCVHLFTFSVNDTSTTADLRGLAWCRTFPSFVPWFNSVICLILISPWIWCTEPLKWRSKEIKNWTVDCLTEIYFCTFSLIPAESAPKNTQQTLWALLQVIMLFIIRAISEKNLMCVYLNSVKGFSSLMYIF